MSRILFLVCLIAVASCHEPDCDFHADGHTSCRTGGANVVGDEMMLLHVERDVVRAMRKSRAGADGDEMRANSTGDADNTALSLQLLELDDADSVSEGDHNQKLSSPEKIVARIERLEERKAKLDKRDNRIQAKIEELKKKLPDDENSGEENGGNSNEHDSDTAITLQLLELDDADNVSKADDNQKPSKRPTPDEVVDRWGSKQASSEGPENAENSALIQTAAALSDGLADDENSGNENSGNDNIEDDSDADRDNSEEESATR